MLAFAVLILALISRLLPHALHAASWNFTALGGGLLFFGSRLGSANGERRGGTTLKLAVAMLLLMATDYYLTVFAYGYPFELRGYLVTWAWYAAVCVGAMQWLRRPNAVHVVGGVLAGSTSFFLLSNFAVWGVGQMYPHTAAGLAACYAAAVPFYRNDVVSTALTAGVLFGLPVLAARIAESSDRANRRVEL